MDLQEDLQGREGLKRTAKQVPVRLSWGVSQDEILSLLRVAAQSVLRG